jgi:hypothetical protein
LRGLGEHQIPSHPHTLWEEKYERSKQGLNVPGQLGQPRGVKGGFDPARPSSVAQRFFTPAIYPGRWMLSNIFSPRSLASMTGGDGFVQGQFVGRRNGRWVSSRSSLTFRPGITAAGMHVRRGRRASTGAWILVASGCLLLCLLCVRLPSCSLSLELG